MLKWFHHNESSEINLGRYLNFHIEEIESRIRQINFRKQSDLIELIYIKMENIISSEKPKSLVRSISIVIAENGTVSDHLVSKFLPSIGVKKGASLMDYIQKEYGVEKDQQVILRAEDGKQLDANTLLDEYFERVYLNSQF